MVSKKQNSKTSALRFIRSVNWVLIAVLVVMGVFGKRGWLDLKRMKHENQRVQMELQKVIEQKQFLSADIRELEHDKLAQEHTIRKVLGYIKPDETVIEF